MRINLIVIAILVSFIFEVAYFSGAYSFYKESEKRTFKITNTFPFEVAPKFTDRFGYVNIFALFGVVVNFFPFVYYISQFLEAYSVSIMIVSSIYFFCLACLPFISLNKLREHLYLALGALVMLIAISGLELMYALRQYNLFKESNDLIAAIIAGSIGATTLIGVFNPKLFDLKNTINEQGLSVRKGFISLAFYEWMYYLFGLFTLLPLLFLAM